MKGIDRDGIAVQVVKRTRLSDAEIRKDRDISVWEHRFAVGRREGERPMSVHELAVLFHLNHRYVYQILRQLRNRYRPNEIRRMVERY